MNIVRTLGIFMALAALSFVLGFFVLARLIPGASKPTMATAIPAGTQSGVDQDTAQARPAAPVTQPSRQKPRALAKDTNQQPRVAVAPGPSLDPVNDPPAVAKPAGVQKPRKVDESTTEAANASAKDNSDTSDDEAPASKVKPHAIRTETASVHPKRRRHLAVKKADPAPGAEGDDTTVTRNASGGDEGQDAPVVKPRRPRRARTAAADDTAVASSDEGDTEKPVRHRRNVVASSDEGDTEKPVRHRRTVAADPESASGAVYHVHLGAFHSRDAATHEAERARVKGFATQVVPVTHNGRTLYRVQAGAFRERERAETVKQNLQDASLDASVSEQRR